MPFHDMVSRVLFVALQRDNYSSVKKKKKNMRKWARYVLFCWIIGFLSHFTLRPNKLNIQTLIHLKYSPVFPRGSPNLKTQALLYFSKGVSSPRNLSSSSFFFILFFIFLFPAINCESRVNFWSGKKKK